MSHISIATAAPQGTVPHNTESLRVEELIPAQLRESSETFINLIKEYYEYLNTEGLPTYETNRIIDEHDIDKVSIKYLDGIQGEIAKNIPNSVVVDRVSLYKKIVQYYTLKGSEESITTFFRLFFDEIIEVSYPREKLFSPSSGDWEPANDDFTRTIVASLIEGSTAIKYNYTPFQLKKDDDVLGSGKIIKVTPISLYDNPPAINSLVFDVNSAKNLNSINESWDSIVLKDTWRGYFNNGASFNSYEELVHFDGESAYVDFGDIGEHSVPLDTEEHTFVIRFRPKFNKENTVIQPLFSLSKDYTQLQSHELFFNKDTGKIGRSFVNTNEPRISLNGDDTFQFTNFIDQTTSALNTLVGNKKEHMTKFLSPMSLTFNGKWQETLVTFNGKAISIHSTDPVLKTLTEDDLRFFDFSGSTFDAPNNIKVGNTITYEALADYNGRSTAISEDGNILAIGAPFNDGGGLNAGHVRVFRLNSNSSPELWEQIGSDIDGDQIDQRFGTAISLSSDGTVLAIGAPNNAQANAPLSGKVNVYELVNESWVQKGSTLYSAVDYERSGSSVSLNGDGTRLAIGNDPYIAENSFEVGLEEGNDGGGSLLQEDGAKILNQNFDSTSASVVNRARVFEFDVSNDWVQIGSDITELDNDNQSYTQVSLSDNGRTLLVGTRCNVGSDIKACTKSYINTAESVGWFSSGQRLIFDDGANDILLSPVEKIEISLSNNGKTFVIGIPGKLGTEITNGAVEVYRLGSNNLWSQLGEPLFGERPGDHFGNAVSINSTGNIIAVGASYNDGTFPQSGHTRIYQYLENKWSKVGNDIDGEAFNEYSGSAVSLNATGTRVAVGSPLGGGGKVRVYQLAINANISTFLHAEKHPTDTKSRWSIKSNSKLMYYTEWEDNSAFVNVNPYDLGLRWIIGDKQGDESLPVLPHCDRIKRNADHIFTLHNRGYMSIYYKHNDNFIPWQDITIADTTVYDGERLWEILDYAVDDVYLTILDKPIGGASRALIFKANEYNTYEHFQTLSLDLPAYQRRASDFTHIKLVKSQLIVGTHTLNNTDISQVICVYDLVDGRWSEENSASLPHATLKSVRPHLEFSMNSGVTTNRWKSTNELASINTNTSVNTSLDDGIKLGSSAISTPIGLDVDSKFSLAIRFNAIDIYDSITDILTIGNVTLRISKNPISGNKSLQVVSKEAGKVDYPIFLDKINTNAILDNNPREIFSDQYFNDEIKTDEWNNLVVEFTVGSLSVFEEEVITGLRYSLNGFKRSKTVDVINIIDDEGEDNFQRSPVYGISAASQMSLGTKIAFNHISFYNRGLSHIEFGRIETTLSSVYTSNVTTGINSLLDGGRFEVSENGNVIIKVAAYGINIWEKTPDGWVSFYNPISSITDGGSNYITHSGSRLYSYKFSGNDLILVNGGLNNAQQYLEAYDEEDSSYKRKQHNSTTVAYYIRSQYLNSYISWKLFETFRASVEFEQKNDESLKVGLNYGVDIAIDNANDTFAISLEPDSVNKILKEPASLEPASSENITNVKYDIWKKLSDNFIRPLPLYEPIDGYPLVTSYPPQLSNSGILRISKNAPSYNAVIADGDLIHATEFTKPLVTYTFNTNINRPGYYLESKDIIDDFVISNIPSNRVYLDNKKIQYNEFNIILIRGVADRYNGYIDISVGGSNFERILEGNTLKHLLISPEANFVLGRSVNGYFNGDISHSQYYSSAVSDATKDEIVECLINNVKNFYQIVYEEFDGITLGANRLTSEPLSEDPFAFNTLSGHVFNSFWFFDEPQIRTKISVTADYNQSISNEAQSIYWGDGRSNIIIDNAALLHEFTTNYLGKYYDRKGQVSSVNRIQDSVFWQQFSYNIRSGIRVSDWEKQFVNLVHPAGLRFFASVILLVIRDNHWFGPKFVLFDPETRQNTSVIKVEDRFLTPFRTNQPVEDLRWLESLTAPNATGGYHMPVFQPGWLQGDIRVREFIFEAGLWTKLARSVPGNEAAAKYTYEYSDGNPAEDVEIRILNLNGEPELSIGDVVYQDDNNSPSQNTGIIANIAPDGLYFTGIVKLVGVGSSFVTGEIYTQSYTNTITIEAKPVKLKSEVLNIYGDEEQDAAYLLQDRSSIDVNSEMFMRAVLTAFKYVIPSLVPAAVITKQDYHQNLKFKDVGDISSYLNTRIIDAIADKFTFMNVAAIIEKRNQLSTEGGDGVFLESDSSPYDQELLIDDIADWWNDPEDDADISAPVQIDILSYTGPQLVSGNVVYQDLGGGITIEGLIVSTKNSGNTILVGWRGAINTSASPDFVYPSKPELDQLFVSGTIYTIAGQYDSPEPLVKIIETSAEVSVSN